MDVYESIKKPVFSLAPMEDVTDIVFRNVVAKVGRPDLLYTEFVNVDGLNSKGKEKVMHRLKFDESERPIIAQLWGSNPENFFKSAKLVKEMGFDGVDINMGCAVKKVSNHGSGSGLIKESDLAIEIINATKEGAVDLPVSVKTRLGWDEVDVDGWIKLLLEQNLNVLIVHCRTARGKGAIHANWSHMERIVQLRNEISSNTLLFGNGDVLSTKQGEDYTKRYGIEGIMIGRAAISNPWVFSGREDITDLERLELFKYHLEMFQEISGNTKDFSMLKKFFKAYIKEFNGANELRQRLMECKNTTTVLELLENSLSLVQA